MEADDEFAGLPERFAEAVKGPVVVLPPDGWRARAVAAEAKLAAITDLCNDPGESVSRHLILAILGDGEEASDDA